MAREVRPAAPAATPAATPALALLIAELGDFQITSALADNKVPGQSHTISRKPANDSVSPGSSSKETRPTASVVKAEQSDSFATRDASPPNNIATLFSHAPSVRKDLEASLVVPARPRLVDVSEQAAPSSSAFANQFWTKKFSWSFPSSGNKEDIKAAESFFLPESKTVNEEESKVVLPGKSEIGTMPQYGYMGNIVNADGERGKGLSEVYINTHDPFCLVTLGVQGSDKSHTIASVIESCMLHHPRFINAEPPVKTMVFHFDQDASNYCEAVTLTIRHPDAPPQLPVVGRMVILVSSSYYLQRKKYYEDVPNCTVLPLLFSWKDLDAAQIKTIMRLQEDDSMALYMSAILDMLRKKQRDRAYPDFAGFKKDIMGLKLTGNQRSPLELRLQLLESVLRDAPENKPLLKDLPDLASLLSDDSNVPLIIVDGTNPLMTGTEANGIFEVMLSVFLGTKTQAGKLVVFDEAHKYLKASGTDGLSAALVRAVRLMRHQGLRIAISTQSPNVLPQEVLELLTIAVIHRFHSHDWYAYLQRKLPLPDDGFERVLRLPTGTALVYASGWGKTLPGDKAVREVHIRRRITKDGGVSRVAEIPSTD
ncbi:hypothetical protein HDU86_001286 [Geranomyces michiganensis]|nr:hypothetical protein HDU86_001286 [Geranomyces michiganensis]